MHPAHSEADPILRPKEAAAAIGWAESTLAKSRLSGAGPAFLKVGKLVRYRRSDIEAWPSSRRRRSTSDTGAAA
ncbi:helix-turn-helix domain-containing protein [Ancylobacter sp. A5.8]|uniref:helix-turn-helix transcriptional regulator n=1 Tax=Ancylobacter gelatini TaxID=2919920 RepID=UPI001F4EFD4E|nr:helix-turn-helix domain-containing protein [Ancylobacter gelatini]MCJ8141646.1 helix-turn-helix domain-containing protein [Ancylobacter gelatini]